MIILLLIIAESFMMITFRNAYYSEVETALTNRINTIEGTLAASAKLSGAEKEKLLFNLTNEFGEKVICFFVQAS